MSREESPDPTREPGAGEAIEARLESIGARFEARWAEEQLEAAFAAAGQRDDAPRSVGVIEVGLRDEGSVAPLLEDLGPDLTLRIRRSLPRGARLVFAHGARFVVALPGDPLLEALLIIDRVRDALERQQWNVDGESVDLAFDAGVSTRHGTDEPLAATLEAAERSLTRSRSLAIRRHTAPETEQVASDTAVDSGRSPIPAAWSRTFQGDG